MCNNSQIYHAMSDKMFAYFYYLTDFQLFTLNIQNLYCT
jgi:hypothetical protein